MNTCQHYGKRCRTKGRLREHLEKQCPKVVRGYLALRQKPVPELDGQAYLL